MGFFSMGFAALLNVSFCRHFTSFFLAWSGCCGDVLLSNMGDELLQTAVKNSTSRLGVDGVNKLVNLIAKILWKFNGNCYEISHTF